MELSDNPESSSDDPALNGLAPGFLVGGGRYTLSQIVSRSESGPVWSALDNQMQEKVALKFLPSSLVLDAASFNEFRRKAQQVRKFSHLNFLRIYDLFVARGEPAFLAMELIQGMDLGKMRLEQPDQAFSWEDLKPIVEQICLALGYAHGKGLAHGNLKPTNILIAFGGQIKLANFALKFAPFSPIRDNLSYISPQRLSGNTPDESDDIYALGSILYEALTGSAPFVANDIPYQIRHVRPQSLSERLLEKSFQREVPENISAMILACLAKDAAERPTITALIASIQTQVSTSSILRAPTPEQEAEAFVRTLPQGLPKDQGEESNTDSSQKSRGRVILVTLGSVVLLALLASQWPRRHAPPEGHKQAATEISESIGPRPKEEVIPPVLLTNSVTIPARGTYVGEGPGFSYRYAPREARDLDTNAVNVGVRFSAEGAQYSHCSYVCTSGTNLAGTITYIFRSAKGYIIEDMHLSQASTFYTSGRVRGMYSVDGGRTFIDFYSTPPFRGKSFSSGRSVDLPALNSTNVHIRYVLQRYAETDYKVQFLRDCDDGPTALEITGSVRQQN